MTGNLLIDSLISISAIALMVLVARLLFPSPPAKVTEEAARERLALDEPDFEPTAWLIDSDGRAALVEGKSGDFVVLSRLGLDLLSRRFHAGAAKAAEEDGALVVRLSDPTLPKVKIAAAEAGAWALKLQPGSDI